MPQAATYTAALKMRVCRMPSNTAARSTIDGIWHSRFKPCASCSPPAALGARPAQRSQGISCCNRIQLAGALPVIDFPEPLGPVT